MEKINAMKAHMRKCLEQSIDSSDRYFASNKELIVEQMTLVWDALNPKPASMLEWAKNVYQLHIRSLD